MFVLGVDCLPTNTSLCREELLEDADLLAVRGTHDSGSGDSGSGSGCAIRGLLGKPVIFFFSIHIYQGYSRFLSL